jgi:hypothetical protein
MKSSARHMVQIMTHIVPLCATDGHMLAVACCMQEGCMNPIRRAGLVRCATAHRTKCLKVAAGGTVNPLDALRAKVA